jgi:hypothetical protein
MDILWRCFSLLKNMDGESFLEWIDF